MILGYLECMIIKCEQNQNYSSYLSLKLYNSFITKGFRSKLYSSQQSKIKNKQYNPQDLEEFFVIVRKIHPEFRQSPYSRFIQDSNRQNLINSQMNTRLADLDSIVSKVSPIFKKKQKCKKNYSPVKGKIVENPKLSKYFRYQIFSLITLLNRREHYIYLLKQKNDWKNDPLTSQQIQQRLQKLLNSKTKDRGRVKFNYLTNQQLRSIKYKPKITYQSLNKRNQKQSEDDLNDAQEDEPDNNYQDKYNKNIDIFAWRKQNGVGYNQKIFIVKGGYYQLRKSLLDRGWFQNEDVWSPFFDLKWTTKTSDINYYDLKFGQSVNHFNNNHHLTSKYGITRRLRTLPIAYSIDSDRFYPRCFDLGDQLDFENFVENFKYGFAQSVARRFLVDKKRYQNLQLKIRVVVDILHRRTIKFSHVVSNINHGQFPVITTQQWLIITETLQFNEDQTKQRLKIWRKNQKLDPDSQDYIQKLYQKLDQKVKHYLDILKAMDPQIEINGWRNVWIAKPNFLSRGRGIKCFNNLYDISDYCLGKDVQFVIQKYIEHPLLIEGKKFDIRQWVLIEDFNPPKIWFYQECYIRFCAVEYSLDNISNRFIHLTNNSIQKYNKNANIEKSMWSKTQFIEHIGLEKWKQIQNKLMNIIVWSIKSCEGYVIGKKGSSELVGYDFMIDEKYNPWLIEINMSPSMDYSTPVTKKLVKLVQQDTIKVITGSKKNRDTGLFTCIYRDDEDLDKYNIYKF